VTNAEFAQAFASPDSLVRHNTWKRLNAEDAGQFKWLLSILKSKSWFDRDGAVIALAKAATEKTVSQMTDILKSDKDPYVRQGMAVAMAKMNDPKFYPKLYEALGDKSPVVRRVVVHSLRVHKKKEAVAALIDLFQKEEDPVVQTFIQDSLDELTQAFQGTNPLAWRAWWEEAQKDPGYELGATDDEAKRQAEELGRKLRERTTLSPAVTLKTSERGTFKPEQGGVPILVLPYYLYSKRTMLPFLTQLERINKLFYIDLPPIKSFKEIKTVGNTGLPEYPINQLVQAFEDLRKETKQERFAILACGMNSWIAMRYASTHPKAVSHMVLINPLSSQQAYGNATRAMEGAGKQKNDIELWHFALGRQIDTQTGQSFHEKHHQDQKLPKPDGEDLSIGRRAWSLFFADERDSVISLLWPVCHEDLGGVIIPEFKCFSEAKRGVPTLVIAGKASLYSSVADCQQIAKHYGGSCLVYANSSCMPFAEEPSRFQADIAKFLGNKAEKKGSKESK
jgi:pimeloyl-ACP methyl ester carboxylesterase